MIFTKKEIYTLNGDDQELPGFDTKYNNIVDYILQITDDIWEKKQIHVINETYTNDVIIHTGAEVITGVNTVISGTIKTLQSFPDRKMGGEAVIWSSDDEDKFFSSHRILSTATNLGSTNYGEATEKKVRFRTIADCAVKNNKIYEEWLVRDNLAIINQLGFDPVTLAKNETKYDGKKSIAYKATSQQGKVKPSTFDKSEEMVCDILKRTWTNQPFSSEQYAKNAKIFTIDNQELSTTEFPLLVKEVLRSFSDTSFKVCQVTRSWNEHRQEEIAVRWKMTGKHQGQGYFGNPTGTPILFYGVSHFVIEEGQIIEEYCIFDAFDILCQIHAAETVNTC